MDDSNKPSFIAYNVTVSGENSYWDRVGAAFAHKDGKGFDVMLDSLPVRGRVVLRSPKEQAEAEKAQAEKAQAEKAQAEQ